MAHQGKEQETLDRVSKTQEMVYELTVGEVMATKIVSVSPEQTMADLRLLLRDNRISGTPVVENGKLVGMISIEDLINALNDNAINAPIILRGRKIGTITITRKGDGKWSRLDEGLLDEVSGQVGLAVDNIRLLEEATQRAQQEQTVGKLATHFSQSLDLDTLLQTAARELGQLPDVSEVSVFIGQQDEQALPAKPPLKRNVT